MYYVQLLRLRKALTWFGAAITAVALLIVITMHLPHAETDLSAAKGTIPLSVLFLGASLIAILFATICGTSLNQENEGVEMVWAKPIARERLAFEYMLCDLAAIVTAFVYGLILILLVFASLGATSVIVVDGSAPAAAVLGLGVAMMWNGELQALTSWQIGRGGLMIGLSWAVFAWLLPMCTLLSTYWNPSAHAFLVAANYLNPLAYLATGGGGHIQINSSSSAANGTVLIPLGWWARAAIAWSLGIAGWGAATFAWKRLEV